MEARSMQTGSNLKKAATEAMKAEAVQASNDNELETFYKSCLFGRSFERLTPERRLKVKSQLEVIFGNLAFENRILEPEGGSASESVPGFMLTNGGSESSDGAEGLVVRKCDGSSFKKPDTGAAEVVGIIGSANDASAVLPPRTGKKRRNRKRNKKGKRIEPGNEPKGQVLGKELKESGAQTVEPDFDFLSQDLDYVKQEDGFVFDYVKHGMEVEKQFESLQRRLQDTNSEIRFPVKLEPARGIPCTPNPSIAEIVIHELPELKETQNGNGQVEKLPEPSVTEIGTEKLLKSEEKGSCNGHEQAVSLPELYASLELKLNRLKSLVQWKADHPHDVKCILRQIDKVLEIAVGHLQVLGSPAPESLHFHIGTIHVLDLSTLDTAEVEANLVEQDGPATLLELIGSAALAQNFESEALLKEIESAALLQNYNSTALLEEVGSAVLTRNFGLAALKDKDDLATLIDEDDGLTAVVTEANEMPFGIEVMSPDSGSCAIPESPLEPAPHENVLDTFDEVEELPLEMEPTPKDNSNGENGFCTIEEMSLESGASENVDEPPPRYEDVTNNLVKIENAGIEKNSVRDESSGEDIEVITISPVSSASARYEHVVFESPQVSPAASDPSLTYPGTPRASERDTFESQSDSGVPAGAKRESLVRRMVNRLRDIVVKPFTTKPPCRKTGIENDTDPYLAPIYASNETMKRTNDRANKADRKGGCFKGIYGKKN